MTMRLKVTATLIPCLLLGLTWSQVVVFDDFESYMSDSELEAAWSPDLGNGTSPTTGPIGILVPRTVAPFPVPPFDGSGDPGANPPIEPLVGKAVSYSGLGGGINESTETFAIQPSATQAVKLSADIFEFGFNNRRFSVGLRDDSNAANLIEMGFYNAAANDPFDPNDPPAQLPVTGYAYRAVLFGGIGGDLQREPNWQYFDIDPAFDDPDVDHNGDGKLGNGDGTVNAIDIGPGWHTYSATVELDQITYELDLFRDGTIDASHTWELTYNTAGFYNSLRMGGPSGIGMNQDTMVDNIRLEMVDLGGGGPDCDFDGSGTCDIADLDMLYSNLGTSNPDFDLDGNGSVDNLDIPEWLTQASAADSLGRTFLPGDTDLNGSVEGPDFTTLAVNFGEENATWGQGNFTGNDNNFAVGGPDFTSLALNFGFVSANAVPEPSAMGLVLFAAMTILAGGRGRRLG